LNHASAIFVLVILEIESSSLPKLAWTSILLFCASYHSWDDRCTPPYPAFVHWDGVFNFFCLLISASHVAWDDRSAP
jgi:hypothetical protein